ncbi:TPA: glycosyltransferase [Vibrio parahaemolyticus]|uniref:Glycosyltransferase n=1 Tax=Vibrio parahaemolyticus TaxID=670 RepID=A0A5P4S9M9_VIBPH|nr:glycosyltransferase [Vibrio parahaemolyticus]KIT46951.1 hypothetical protein H337_05700 [Vibrio parahaemolyticus EN9701121]EGQ7914930.1 glycosyltransferase [Vibrio parahaemolyticus]EGQ8486336.1 glycosyltransferase [Vibrio parahaemolyticus]EGQ9218764.1 glycosyltransferase [Vibrio parahaemolyticus]EGR1690238.1 glycosyltransferase [Vibrio parahaemolyticus]
MKLAMLNDWLQGGGAERSMVYIANEISKRTNEEIDIYCLEGGNSFELNDLVKHKPIRRSFSSKYHKLYALLFDALFLRKKIRENNIETMLSFQFRSNLVNVISRLFGAKHRVIISERVYANHFYKDVWYSSVAFFMIRFFYNKADLVTCNAEDIKQGLIEIGVKKPIIVITNGYPKENIIDKAINHSVLMEDNFLPNKISLLSIGRLSEQKGHRYLLEALSMIENVDDYRLTIIGEGPLKSELEKLIDDYSLKSVVKIIPFTSNPYCYFHKANFLVFPSLYEGYPNVICESLILGCPVLAFDFKSGSRELVSKENGKLVALKDVVGLADSISKFDYKGYNVNSEGINSVEALASQYQSVIGL